MLLVLVHLKQDELPHGITWSIAAHVGSTAGMQEVLQKAADPGELGTSVGSAGMNRGLQIPCFRRCGDIPEAAIVNQ